MGFSIGFYWLQWTISLENWFRKPLSVSAGDIRIEGNRSMFIKGKSSSTQISFRLSSGFERFIHWLQVFFRCRYFLSEESATFLSFNIISVITVYLYRYPNSADRTSWRCPRLSFALHVWDLPAGYISWPWRVSSVLTAIAFTGVYFASCLSYVRIKIFWIVIRWFVFLTGSKWSLSVT